MSALLPLLFGGACVLGAAGIGVSAIMNEQKQRRRFHERLALVAAPYIRINPLATTAHGGAKSSSPVAQMIAPRARLFGYDPARAENNRLRWCVVLGIALMVARASATMVGMFAGEWS